MDNISNIENKNKFLISGWRRKIVYLIPFISIGIAFMLTLLGRPSPKEQARRILQSHQLSRSFPLKTLSSILLLVKEDYVDKKSIEPIKMFKGAVNALERFIPEIIIKKQDKLYNINIGTKAIPFNLSKINSPLLLYKNILKLFKVVTENVQDIKLEKVEEELINGMLQTLDPHTMLLSPSIYREMKTRTRGSFNGIGIVVVQKNGFLTVIAPIDDTPAAKAGVKAGDKIVKIGDLSTVNLSLNEAVNLLRGNPETTVTIWVERIGAPNLIRFILNRTIIHLNSVNSRILEANVGYLRIKQFTQTTSKELSEHLNRMKTRGVKSLIIDLYNNPGGLLKEARKCADIFMDSGIIFTAVSQKNLHGDINSASTLNTLWKENVIVLINKGSASASEILAGALKHNLRALIMGEKSFGKGSIQMVTENSDGSALKMTIAHYLSAGKIAIQSRGVIPNIKIVTINVENPHHPIFTDWVSKDTREHVGPSIGSKDYPPWFSFKILSTWEDRESVLGSINNAPTSLIKLARRILVHLKNSNLLDKTAITSFMKKEESVEMRKLLTILGKKGIDWTAGNGTKHNPSIEATVTFENSRKVVAGKTLNGKVELRNLGTGPAFRLSALVQNTPYNIPKELLFGTLTPGAAKTVPFKYVVDSSSPPALWPLKIEYKSNDLLMDSKKLPKTTIYPIQVVPSKKPVFKIHYHTMDDIGGNGDGLCQPGEKLRLRIMVTNIGKGTATDTIVTLQNKSGKNATISKGNYKFGRLLPGETRTEDFSINVRRVISKPLLKFQLVVEDHTFGINSKYVITQRIHKLKPGPMPIKGFFIINKNSPLREGMDEYSVIIGQGNKGAIFPIVGTLGKWVKIQLHPERSAFALSSVGEVTSKSSIPLLSPRWTPIYQITTPTISVNSLPLHTNKSIESIEIRVSHPEGIKDIFIESFSTSKKYEKLFYISGQNKKSFTVKTQIHIHPGISLIRITVRTTHEHVSTWKQFVYMESK
jgi:carboxyl-terminal processing protease